MPRVLYVVWCVAVAVAELGTGHAAAQTLEKVSMAFSFNGSGSISNFYAAQDQGFFKAAGLDVTWVSPGNAADSVKLLAANQVNFALVNSTDVVLARSRGVPIKSVLANTQYGMAGVMVPIEFNVTSLKQLEGHTIAMTGLPANRAMFFQVMRKNDVDASKLKVIDVGFGTLAIILSGKADVIGDAITYGEPIGFNKARGKPFTDTSAFTYFAFSEYGGPKYYAYNVNVSEDYLAKNGDTVRRFTQGWRAATAWAVENPEAAVKHFLGHFPEMDPASALAAWKIMAALVKSPDTDAHQLGWQNEKVWSDISEFMFDIKAAPVKIDPTAAFTNDY